MATYFLQIEEWLFFDSFFRDAYLHNNMIWIEISTIAVIILLIVFKTWYGNAS